MDDAEIIAATLEPPPDRSGVTHWSTRLLAAELGLGDASASVVARHRGRLQDRR
jgi:hypothetical protein